MGQDNQVTPEIDAPPKEKNSDKYTLPTEQLASGPVQDRSCTDVICCLTFVAFLVFLVGAGGYGLIHGKPELLLTPWDSDGNGCGLSKDPTKDYPYLYFPFININAATQAASDPTAASPTDILKYGACVKTCPSKTSKVECKQPIFMKTQKGKQNYKDCVYYIGGVQVGVAARYETSLLGRFCVPSGQALQDEAVKAFQTQFQKYFGKYNIQSYISDIFAAREVLYWTLLTGFAIGFVYMIFMRLFGGPLVYFSILGLIGGTAYGGWMVYQTWQGMDPAHPHYQYYQYGAYTIWGIAALLLCCTLCNWNNIKIGVAVMKCTAQYIGNNPQVFLVPPLACVIILAWLLVWCYFAAHIVSIGEIEQSGNGPLTKVVWSPETRYVFLYSLFGYLWLNAFIIGVTQFIISASAALWYFTSSGDSNGKGSLMKGLYWVFRYHLGSIAFGSFLIALVQFIRIIFEYYKRQLEKAGKENKVVKILLCLTSYLLDCLERFIKFISKNAYIQIALTGKSFCKSAWNAFLLIAKNIMRFGTANSIGFIFNVLGVCFIAGANGIVVYALLHYVPAYKGLASNFIGPAVIGVIQGFIIGTMFMSVFSFASDTILQAFLVDEELKRPEGMRPPIMNQFIEGIEKNKGLD